MRKVLQSFPSSYAAGSPEEAAAKQRYSSIARQLFSTTREFNVLEDLKSIPEYKQTQRSLQEQLVDARAILNRVGLHDAADLIQGL